MAMRSSTGTDQDWTTRRLLAWIIEAFTKKGLESPRLQAEMLVAHVIGCDRLRLYMEADRPASPLERSSLRDLVGRALNDEPIDYLVGERWFFGLPFHVSPAVLVPRPCTEVIVEQVLLHARVAWGGVHSAKGSGGEGIRIADVCTGSGCIAIALLKNLGAATAIATDLSVAALAVATKNAERHKVSDRLELIEGDLLEPLISHTTSPAAHDGRDGFHYLVSNPPYIPDREWDAVPANVRKYEPESALRGGEDGLRLLRPLVEGAPRLVRPGGLLLLETAESTARTVLGMVREHPLLDESSCRVIKDLDGLDRVVAATRRG